MECNQFQSNIGIYCFSVKDAALRSGWNRDNVSEWIEMSTRKLAT